MTSGAGGALPRGLPVGAVAGVRDGLVAVDLDANYARTRIVRILNYEFPSLDGDVDPFADEPAEEEKDGPAATEVAATEAG